MQSGRDDAANGTDPVPSTLAASPTVAGPSTTPVTTEPDDPSADVMRAGAPEVRDVTVYATDLGITVQEARRRNSPVESFLAGELFELLDGRDDFY